MPLVWVNTSQYKLEAQKMEKPKVENSVKKILDSKADEKGHKPRDTIFDETIASSFKKQRLGVWMVRMESDQKIFSKEFMGIISKLVDI